MKKIKSINLENVYDYIDFELEEKYIKEEEKIYALKISASSNNIKFLIGYMFIILLVVMNTYLNSFFLEKYTRVGKYNIAVLFLKLNIYFVFFESIIFLGLLVYYYKLDKLDENKPKKEWVIVLILTSMLLILNFNVAIPFGIQAFYIPFDPKSSLIIPNILVNFILILNILLFFKFKNDGKNEFLLIKNKTKISIYLEKIKLLFPFIGIIAIVSFGIKGITRNLNETFYRIITPYILIFSILITFYIMRFFFQLVYYYYLRFKFSEYFREIEEKNVERFYGSKYFKSKDVMNKIKEYEKYSKEKELGINE